MEKNGFTNAMEYTNAMGFTKKVVINFKLARFSLKHLCIHSLGHILYTSVAVALRHSAILCYMMA
jgi:hypothetical protein